MAPELQTLLPLPPELFEEILRFALSAHPAPHAIPRVNSSWAAFSLPLLHANISLTSIQQLHLFSTAQGVLCCAAGGREVEVRLPGGTEGTGLWAMISRALARCHGHGAADSNSKTCCRGVRVLRLCLNSHLNDPNAHLISEALCRVSPEVFAWRGPDPDHHFSTAIVSTAAHQLCKAIATWSALHTLELSNIAFLNNGFDLCEALLDARTLPFSSYSGPVRVVISQAVFILPIVVLRIALGVSMLEELRLIDVYQHSIWGFRLRLDDVERLVTDERACGVYTSEKEALARVRDVVCCVARTERLIGGDRAF
ncbi:hypothetical protein K439DRAFT_339820 [Ramaria rubella]|nr:hypothetical protein K439DRAFT_339820 [Ramaria rubella]